MKALFARRRRRFLRLIRGGAAVLKTHSVKHRTADQDYVFRANSDFYYLTGLREPESIAVFAPEQKRQKFTIFVRPKDRAREIWDGRRLGPEAARRVVGADAAFPIARFVEELPGLLNHSGKFYHKLGLDPEFDAAILRILDAQNKLRRKGGKVMSGVLDPTFVTNRMRLIKDREELKLMQRAADITAAGHRAALRALRPGLWEYEIDAILNFHYRRLGAMGSAYPAIVASGANACILHYQENNRRMKAGDLLLIDSGAEYEFYSCDVTRTFPVSGRFTPEQRAIYDVVLAAQRAVIRMVRPGLRYSKLHERTIQVIVRGLKRLGLLHGPESRIIKKKEYFKFFMHGTGHWLGLDTHDECPYVEDGRPIRLEPGMVFTVEPGVYVHEDVRGVPKRFKGIGVRIEDDVLVTNGSPRVLTAAIPKDPNEIEAFMATQQK
jgi:Xaa-Pro aminopeptidase